MRILHIITKLEMGGAQYNTILSAADSVRRGHDVFVAASGGKLSDYARELLGDRWIEMGCDPFPDSGGKRTTPEILREIRPVGDYRAYRGLSQLIGILKPDIVHTHSSKAGILGRFAASASKPCPKIIHTVHGWGFHADQSALVRAAFIRAERAAAKITDRLVVVADSNRKTGLDEGIGNSNQYVTIRSGIQLDFEKLTARRSAVRMELGIPDDNFLVCWVGNFKPQKDPRTMAEAAVRLSERPGASFIALGDGEMRSMVEERLGGLPADQRDRVILAGWREDAQEILAASDILLHTARFEGLPRAILEAMNLGKAVVSTNVDGIPEAVADGQTGYLFETGDIDGMVDAVIRLADDEGLRKRMGEAGKAAFTREFTLTEMFDRLHRLYDEVMR